MAIIVNGTKTNPHNNDTLIIKDSEDGNALKEIPFASLGVAAVTLTATVGSVLTYSLWADAGETGLIGTFDVVNGTNGTGISIPDYDVLRSYSTDECTLDTNGILYRSLGNANVGNVPVPNSAFWYQVPLGGAQTVHNPDADYALGDMVIRTGKLYTPNDAIAGATTAVPFVEGNGLQEWTNMALSPFAPHDIFATYNIHDVVQSNGKIYQANGNGISGTLSVGRGAGQFRNAGTQLVRSPLITRLGGTGTHSFDPDCSYATVEMVGAGAGRGRIGTASTSFQVCPAGGAGAYLNMIFSGTALDDMAYVVGQATTGAIGENTSPTTGGFSSLVVNAATIIAGGGIHATLTLHIDTALRAGGTGGQPTFPAITDVVYIVASYGDNGETTTAAYSANANWNGSYAGNGAMSPMAIRHSKGQAYSLNIQDASISIGGIGYGYGACGISVGRTNVSNPTQVQGGHGTILITEYFS